MKDSVFSRGIRRLETAFRHQPLSQDTLKIYYEKLKEVDDRRWSEAVEAVIDTEDFFPSISRLLKECGLEPSYDAAGRILKVLK